MAFLTITPTWSASIYQIEQTDAIDAGIGGNGIANRQAITLGCNDLYLYNQLSSLIAGTLNITTQPMFDFTSNPATDAFVILNGGRYSTCYRQNTSASIGSGSFGWSLIAGALIVADALANNAQVFTLASLASLPPGMAVHFKNESAFPFTLTAATGELFVSKSNLDTDVNSINVYPGCDITIIRSQNNSILGTGTPCWQLIVHSGNIRTWRYIGASGQPAFGAKFASGSVTFPPYFIKKGNKVFLGGVIQGTAFGSSDNLFVLPAAYRPATFAYGFVLNNTANTPEQLLVDASGNVTVYGISGSNTFQMILDGYSFDIYK